MLAAECLAQLDAADASFLVKSLLVELLQCPSDEIKLKVLQITNLFLKQRIQPRRLRIKDSGLTLLHLEKNLEMVKLIRYTGFKHHIKLQIASQRVESSLLFIST